MEEFPFQSLHARNKTEEIDPKTSVGFFHNWKILDVELQFGEIIETICKSVRPSNFSTRFWLLFQSLNSISWQLIEQLFIDQFSFLLQVFTHRRLDLSSSFPLEFLAAGDGISLRRIAGSYGWCKRSEIPMGFDDRRCFHRYFACCGYDFSDGSYDFALWPH